MTYQQWSRRRFSRRRTLAGTGALGAGVAGFALVGCGDDDDDDSDGGTSTPGGSATPGGSPTGSAGQPQTGGTLTVPLGTPQTGSLDPHISVSAFMNYWPLFGNLLINADPKTLEPLQGQLLESWEQVDDLTMTLKVRQGITWHEGHHTNGRPFTAEDVAFNLLRIQGKQDPDRSAQFQRASTLLGQDTVTVIDDSTVEVKFSQPNSIYLHGMADWRNFAVAQEAVEADPNFTDGGNWSGTGPFTVESFDTATATGTFVRNPNYWQEGRPYVDSVRQLSIPDPASQISAFLTGQTDFLVSAQSKSVRDQVTGQGGDSHIAAWDALFWHYFGFNPNRPGMDNPDVRKAIFLALNYPVLMDAAFGEGFWTPSGPMCSVLPGTMKPDEVLQQAGYNPDTKDADIEEAKRLMDAAGFPDGEGLSFGFKPSAQTGDSYDQSVFAQGDLQQIFPDADIRVDVPPTGEFARHLTAGDYDIVAYVISSGASAFLDPVLRYRQDGSRNYIKYANPEIDTIINSALAEFDTDARNELAGELEQILLNEVINVTVGIPKQVNGVNNRVQGFDEIPGPGTSIFPFDCWFAASQVWIDEA